MPLIEYKSTPSGSSVKYIYVQNGVPKEYTEETVADIPKLEIYNRSLGFLCDCGVIPSPMSPYKDLKLLNSGDSLTFDIDKKEETVYSKFHYERKNSLQNNLNFSLFEEKL